jgi:CHASE3 domain sensor protein
MKGNKALVAKILVVAVAFLASLWGIQRFGQAAKQVAASDPDSPATQSGQ